MVSLYKKLRDSFFQGISFILGIVSILIILVGVYAFVEPSSTPSLNNVLSGFTQAQSGLSANSGQYNNRIPEGTFPSNYTEVCFKSGITLHDIDVGGSSTTGGNCSPGDVGFIIEQNQRTLELWSDAKMFCLQNGMRLPEPSEFQYACNNAASFGLNSMIDDWEWSSNTALPMYQSTYAIGAPVMGGGSCTYASWDTLGRSDGVSTTHTFRCVK